MQPQRSSRVPAPAPNTEPIGLHLTHRGRPPEPGQVLEPFADGRRPVLPVPGGPRLKVLGAPIPDDHVHDPTPSRRGPRASMRAARRDATRRWQRRWSPRRRRRLARTATVLLVGASLVLVLLAALSVLLG